MNLLTQQLTYAAQTARCLALCAIADLGCAITAWAHAQDLDTAWTDFQEEINR